MFQCFLSFLRLTSFTRLIQAAIITSAVGGILSKVLSANQNPSDGSESCSVIVEIQDQMEELFSLVLGPLLAGESDENLLNDQNVAGGVVRTDQSDGGKHR